MENRLKTARKTSYTFAITCQYPSSDGEGNITYLPYDLTNYTVTLGVKERKDSKTYIIYSTGTVATDATTGVVTFDLLPADTDVQPKVYIYGILLENSFTEDRRELYIENPFFEIEPSIIYEPAPTS